MFRKNSFPNNIIEEVCNAMLCKGTNSEYVFY